MGKKTIVVRTKSDLIDSVAQRRLRDAGSLLVSAKTDSGVDQLLNALTNEALSLGGGEPALVTHARQRHALKESVARLESAVSIAAEGQEELVAEELRLAARALGRVTGRVDVEDVLDQVFQNFCIGK